MGRGKISLSTLRADIVTPPFLREVLLAVTVVGLAGGRQRSAVIPLVVDPLVAGRSASVLVQEVRDREVVATPAARAMLEDVVAKDDVRCLVAIGLGAVVTAGTTVGTGATG